MNLTGPTLTWTHGYNSERQSEFVHFRCAACRPVYLGQLSVPSSADLDFNSYGSKSKQSYHRALQKSTDLGYFYQRIFEEHYQTLRNQIELSNV